jgi:hypothetical protein
VEESVIEPYWRSVFVDVELGDCGHHDELLAAHKTLYGIHRDRFRNELGRPGATLCNVMTEEVFFRPLLRTHPYDEWPPNEVRSLYTNLLHHAAPRRVKFWLLNRECYGARVE